MPEIKSPEDWWKAVHDNSEQLFSLISTYHPCYLTGNLQHEITAVAAEAICEVVREEVKKSRLGSPLAQAQEAIQMQDFNTLLDIFNETWFGMPESLESRMERGFGVLCDLCSEAWVFEPEDEATTLPK